MSDDLIRDMVVAFCETQHEGYLVKCIYPKCGCITGKSMRAALAVLREPSEAMLDAGNDPIRPTLKRRWQAMLDKADG